MPLLTGIQQVACKFKGDETLANIINMVSDKLLGSAKGIGCPKDASNLLWESINLRNDNNNN